MYYGGLGGLHFSTILIQHGAFSPQGLIASIISDKAAELCGICFK